MPNTAECYVSDLAKEIVALAKDAQRKLAASDDGFQKGRQLAFYEVLSLMKQQAVAFGLDERDIGLAYVSPEEFLT